MSKGLINGLTVEVYGDFTRALRTFNKKVQDSGKLREVRERMQFESGSESRKKSKSQARKRQEKKIESETLVKSKF